MSDNKSLGSSPFGFNDKKSTMAFIPDRNESKTKEKPKKPISAVSSQSGSSTDQSPEPKKRQKSEKKVVSYYLEVELVDKIKSVADHKDIYYSSLVSMALREWIANHT
ncbi:hypothetical protein [Fodinibius sp. Rm-B-1B1-1]|uniref:hypothetical protein n=1 Tax=Fodinibius alkaliphilus TaxID=3140241 RepID=UPI00315A671A